MDVTSIETSDSEQVLALLKAQAAEIEELRAQINEKTDRVSRRGIVKGLGFGSLVALGAAGASLAGGGAPSVFAAPGGAVENSDLAGEMPALLSLKIGGAVLVGDATGPGRAGQIEVLYYQSDVKTPRDAASGQATGKRQYAPIIIRKRIDKASPLLAKALANNQTGDSAMFSFYRSTSKSNEGNKSNGNPFYTVELKNVHVASIQQLLPDVHQSSGEVSTPPIEEVTFVFQKITWTYVDGGISASDDWEAPIG